MVLLWIVRGLEAFSAGGEGRGSFRGGLGGYGVNEMPGFGFAALRDVRSLQN